MSNPIIPRIKLTGLALLFALGFSQIASATEEPLTLEEIDNQKTELAALDSELANLPSSEESIEKVASILGRTAAPSAFQVDERWEVNRHAQTKLLGIPGHIPYFKRKLEEAKQRIITKRTEDPDTFPGKEVADYQRTKRIAFDTLGWLPTDETVKLLGEFLGDDYRPGYEENPREAMRQSGETSTSSILAARSLARLLEESPTTEDPVSYGFDEADAWKKWYADVERGLVKYHFRDHPSVSKRHNQPRGGADEKRLPKEDPSSAPLAPRSNSLAKWATLIAAALAFLAAWRLLALRRRGVGRH